MSMSNLPPPPPPPEDGKSPSPPPPPPLKKVEPPVQNMMYLDIGGEVLAPPSAVDLEEVILGAIMIDSRGADEGMPLLSRDVFYDLRHQKIFEALQSLYSKGDAIDLLTVSNELQKAGNLSFVGGSPYLIGITQKVGSAAHIEYHIRIVMQKFVLRELIDIARRTITDSLKNDPDVFDMMNRYDQKNDYINNIIIKGSETGNEDPLEELRKKVERARAGETPGIYTGVSEFDSWCAGFQPRELITIAARPGMGKTTAGLSMAIEGVLVGKHKAVFLSLEMSNIDLCYRLAARLEKIPFSSIRTGQLNDDEFQRVSEAIKYIKSSDLKIFDTSVHKNMHAKICKIIRDEVKRGAQIVWLDYVQLIKLVKYSKDRTAELSTITRELKALANELNVPIIQFAQLSRSIDNRPDKMPRLADLKQSGSIEEDSDTVIFLLRDAYYQQANNTGVDLPPHVTGRTKFIVAKGRNIGTSTFDTYLDFKEYYFKSYSEMDFNS